MDAWTDAVREKYDTDPSHLTVSRSMWIITSWRSEDVPHFATCKNIIDEIDKIHQEMLDNANTTIKPISMSTDFNILTNAGMTEMARRSTAQSTSTNTHHGIGTGTNAETVGDTVLQTEQARRTIGTRNVLNQTERYGTTFQDSDVTGTQQITEAGIFTASSGGTMIARVTTTPQTLETGTTLTVQTNITHQNGTA